MIRDTLHYSKHQCLQNWHLLHFSKAGCIIICTFISQIRLSKYLHAIYWKVTCINRQIVQISHFICWFILNCFWINKILGVFSHSVLIQKWINSEFRKWILIMHIFPKLLTKIDLPWTAFFEIFFPNLEIIFQRTIFFNVLWCCGWHFGRPYSETHPWIYIYACPQNYIFIK